MPDIPEIERIEDFVARELIDLVKKECQSTMDVGDSEQVLKVIKRLLNGRNVKKNVFERARFHLLGK